MTMKHLTISTLGLLFSLAPSQLHAEEKPLPSKLVAISASASLKKEENELQRLFNYGSSPALRLTFLLKTENIVEIDKQSVTTTDGKEWKCASFPRISDANDAAAFIIERAGDYLEKSHETKVEGTIEIKTGTKLIPKSFSLLTYDEPFRMDDFIFTLLQDKLKIDGNHKLIKEITVEYDDKILSTHGSSWSDKSRTYTYKGIGKGAKITFSYWDGLVTKKVQFSKK